MFTMKAAKLKELLRELLLLLLLLLLYWGR